jgi:hypothetical protein
MSKDSSQSVFKYMDNFKERFFALEKNVQEIEQSLCKIQRTTDDIQYVSIDKEQGIIPLDEFDTFRFMRAIGWLVTEYTYHNGVWRHGISSTSSMYFLVNPTQEVKNRVEYIAGHAVDFSKYTICFKYNGDWKSFERALTERELPDFYMFWYQGGPCYGKLTLTKELRNELETKLFEIETLPQQKVSMVTHYDMLLKNFIQGMNYTASFTVDFKDDVAYLKYTQDGAPTWVPTMSTISVTVAPIYNRTRLRQFNLTEYANGNIVAGQGFI